MEDHKEFNHNGYECIVLYDDRHDRWYGYIAVSYASRDKELVEKEVRCLADKLRELEVRDGKTSSTKVS